jgi:hypothetical protein
MTGRQAPGIHTDAQLHWGDKEPRIALRCIALHGGVHPGHIFLNTLCSDGLAGLSVNCYPMRTKNTL